MGNLQKSKINLKTIQPQYFNENNLYRVMLTGHMSKVFALSILYLDDLNKIIISTIGKYCSINIYTLTNKTITKYSSKKKSKSTNIKPLLKIPINTKYSSGIGSVLIYNKHLNAILTISAVEDELTIFNIDISKKSYSIFCRFRINDVIISSLKFMNDNTNRIIIGSRDGCVSIYEYTSKQELFHLQMSDNDIEGIDYYHNSDKEELIICSCSIDGFISISTINDIDIQNMKNINLIKLKVSDREINCIGFSPMNNNNKYIICGDENGICTVLMKDKLDNKYCIAIQETLKTVDDKSNAITSVCWLNSNTFICGMDTGNQLKILHLDVMNKNKKVMKIIGEHLNKIEHIAQIIADFCGIYIDMHSIKTNFHYTDKTSSISSLIDYKISPGIFVTSSWSGSTVLYIPMIDYTVI